MMGQLLRLSLLALFAPVLLSIAQADTADTAAAPGTADPASDSTPPLVTTLTKNQMETLVDLCAAHGVRQSIKPEIADFLGLVNNESGQRGYPTAVARFKNGDECSFIQLGKARYGYLFGRSDGTDGFTYIFHVDVNLKLITAMKIGLAAGRFTTPAVGLSSDQAHAELSKVFTEWLVVIDHFQETAAN